MDIRRITRQTRKRKRSPETSEQGQDGTSAANIPITSVMHKENRRNGTSPVGHCKTSRVHEENRRNGTSPVGHRKTNVMHKKNCQGGTSPVGHRKTSHKACILHEENTKSKDFVTGSVIWGKFYKSKWWPGLVIEGPLAGRKPAKDTHKWIFWFGDHMITEMKLCHIEDIKEKWSQRCSIQCTLGQRAVNEAWQVCASRANTEVSVNYSVDSDEMTASLCYSRPTCDDPLPDWIQIVLEQLKDKIVQLKPTSENAMDITRQTSKRRWSPKNSQSGNSAVDQCKTSVMHKKNSQDGTSPVVHNKTSVMYEKNCQSGTSPVVHNKTNVMHEKKSQDGNSAVSCRQTRMMHDKNTRNGNSTVSYSNTRMMHEENTHDGNSTVSHRKTRMIHKKNSLNGKSRMSHSKTSMMHEENSQNGNSAVGHRKTQMMHKKSIHNRNSAVSHRKTSMMNDKKGQDGNSTLGHSKESMMHNKNSQDGNSLVGCGHTSVMNVIKSKPEDFVTGSVIWGKFFKSKWWPGIVIEGPLAGRKPAKDINKWIFWFGDHMITEMKLCQIEDIKEKWSQRCSNQCKPGQRAVYEALQICASRANTEVSVNYSVDTDEMAATLHYSHPICDDPLPDWIQIELSQLKDKIVRLKPTSENDRRCFSCHLYFTMVCKHPLFEGEICEDCKDFLYESLLDMDDDGSDGFCCICGNVEEKCLFVCSRAKCLRSYCRSCLETNCKQELITKIKTQGNWSCFLCNQYTEASHGRLKPVQNFKMSVMRFFNPVNLTEQKPLQSLRSLNKDKLRVLSIHDGIGALKVALDGLHLETALYNASEINPKAIAVSSNCASISQIGEANGIQRTTLKTMMPFDLIYLSPPDPCVSEDQNEDIELEYDRHVAIIKCVILLKDIQVLSDCQPYFWILETTPTIPSDLRRGISNILQVEPCVISCQYVGTCPYVKARLYWSNIAEVYRIAMSQKATKPCCVKLDWSNLVGKESRDDVDTLDELERLMGFPWQYTKIKDLSCRERALLLKEASCPHMLRLLLRPLAMGR